MVYKQYTDKERYYKGRKARKRHLNDVYSSFKVIYGRGYRAFEEYIHYIYMLDMDKPKLKRNYNTHDKYDNWWLVDKLRGKDKALYTHRKARAAIRDILITEQYDKIAPTYKHLVCKYKWGL